MTLEDLLPYVLPEVPSCPRDMALQQIRLAAIELCSRTLVWTEQQDAITTVIGQDTYSLNLDEGQEIAKLLNVWVGATEIEVVTASEGRRRKQTNSGRECAYSSNRQDIVMHPTPTVVGTLIVAAALKPSIDAEDLDDDVFSQHINDVAHGALAGLMAMNKTDWNNPDAAREHRATFNSRVSTLAIRRGRGYGKRRYATSSAKFF